MEDALLLVSEDWRGSIMGGLFIVLLIVIGLIGRNTLKKQPSLQGEPKPLVVYRFLSIYFCLYLLDGTFHEAIFLLHAFPGSAIFGWISIGVAAAYAAAFFRSVCLLTALRPGALRLTRIFLFSFTPFAVVLPLATFVVCAWWMGGEYTLSDYAKHRDLRIAFAAGCLFSVPWLLYFFLSPKVKKLAL